jgi:hypothetical protein
MEIVSQHLKRISKEKNAQVGWLRNEVEVMVVETEEAEGREIEGRLAAPSLLLR